MVSGNSWKEYGKTSHTPLGVSPSTFRPLLDYVLKRVQHLIPQFICPRPAEEMKSIMTEYYANLGLDLPAPVFGTIGYMGDGRHYLCRLPNKESESPKDLRAAEELRAANEGKWGEDVNVSGDAYSKLSPKPKTKNKVSNYLICLKKKILTIIRFVSPILYSGI